MCNQNKRLKQGNNDVYTKIPNPNKNNKTKIKSTLKEAPKKNTKLLLEELYIKKQNIYRKLTLRKNSLERVNRELNTQVLKVSVSVK